MGVQLVLAGIVTNRTSEPKAIDAIENIEESWEYLLVHQAVETAAGAGEVKGIIARAGYSVQCGVRTPGQYGGTKIDEFINAISGAGIIILIRSDYSKKSAIGFAVKSRSAKSKELAAIMRDKFDGFNSGGIYFSVDDVIDNSVIGENAPDDGVYVEISIGHANDWLRNDENRPVTIGHDAGVLIGNIVLDYLKEKGAIPEYTPGGVSDDASSKVAPDMTEATEYDMEIPARPSIQASIGAAAETVLANIHEKQMTITCDYLVYFDDVCMNDFVLSYSCALGVDMGIGRASVTLLYAPAFHQIKVNTSVADGIENGTQIRIFMRNVFDYTYDLCFEGIIKQRTIVRDAHGFTLSFSAVDYMYWMNKIIAPISIPLNEAISPGERLKWKAQSVDPETTANVEITQAGSLKGKTLQEYFDRLKTKSFENSKIYSEPNSVANWDDVVNRVEIMGDINEQLVHDEVIDFVVNSNAVFADTVYVSLSNTTQSLLMEMYQDRDGIVRIKPPFWNEPVLKNHVIDPMMILSAQESTDWNRYYTRIIVTGGVEEWMDSGTTAEKVDLLTPVGVYLGSLTDRNAAKWADYTTEGTLPSSYGSVAGETVGQLVGGLIYYNGLIRPVSGTDSGYDTDTGLDVHCEIGTPVYAPCDGTILYSEYGHTPWGISKFGSQRDDTPYSIGFQPATAKKYGNTTVNYVFLTHLSRLVYDVVDGSGGKEVKAGELIAYSGTANDAPHLHIGLYTARGGSNLSMSQVSAFFGSKSGSKWQAGK